MLKISVSLRIDSPIHVLESNRIESNRVQLRIGLHPTKVFTACFALVSGQCHASWVCWVRWDELMKWGYIPALVSCVWDDLTPVAEQGRGNIYNQRQNTRFWWMISSDPHFGILNNYHFRITAPESRRALRANGAWGELSSQLMVMGSFNDEI